MSITTIWSILNNGVNDLNIKRGINIPMIQRDYVQGRKNNRATEIRKVFLTKINKSIINVVENNMPPLELDFIYGYIENDSFIPLDGQQRLTTLYLIHWYFAFKEQSLPKFEIPFSKFIYQTRQSSEDFLKSISTKLTDEDFNAIFIRKETFDSLIKDKNWYYISWKYDLTIQSAITMLDEIHLVFNNTDIMFSDLISEDNPPIMFNFLNVQNYGLSDDLYIKMNARGKSLTNFENLKAELGRFIELSNFNNNYEYSLKHSSGEKIVNVETYFVTRIDTVWTDYFWNLRNKETNEFDDKLLNLLAFISLNEAVITDLEKFEKCIADLDSNQSNLSYYKFISLELLNENTIINYINILDLIVSKNKLVNDYLVDEEYLKKRKIIEDTFVNDFNSNYEGRILFYAVFKFLLLNKTSLDTNELKKWDRIIRNVVRNTIYNTPKDFQDSMLSIDNMLEFYEGDIYQTFQELKIKGFDNQQIKEEKLKIALINKSQEWSKFIHEAESRPYLEGQIMILLSFSGIYNEYLENNLEWTSEISNANFNRINSYFSKYDKLFKDDGIRDFDEDIFRRALLVKGDYLLYSTNWSFLIDNHRDVSWKRLFKETGNFSNDYYIERCIYLKELFDEIDIKDVVGSMKKIIESHNCTDWRKDFIDNPILLEKSKRKYIKIYEFDNRYVLRKSKYNRYEDPEIKAILLKEILINNGFNDEDVELGYIDNLNQYGIKRIGRLRPKIVYNNDGKKMFLIKQWGEDDVESDKQSEFVNYLIETFCAK